MRWAMSRVPKAVRIATDAGVSIFVCAHRAVPMQLHARTTRLRVLTGRSVRRTLRRRVLQLFVLASVRADFVISLPGRVAHFWSLRHPAAVASMHTKTTALLHS